ARQAPRNVGGEAGNPLHAGGLERAAQERRHGDEAAAGVLLLPTTRSDVRLEGLLDLPMGVTLQGGGDGLVGRARGEQAGALGVVEQQDVRGFVHVRHLSGRGRRFLLSRARRSKTRWVRGSETLQETCNRSSTSSARRRARRACAGKGGTGRAVGRPNAPVGPPRPRTGPGAAGGTRRPRKS